VVATLVAWLFVVVVVVASRETVDLTCVFMLGTVAVTVGTDTAFMFVTSFRFTYGTTYGTMYGGNDGCDGMGNDGSDGSSSENECNGKFDLNHF
jgi:hypothetical protein